MIQNFKQFNEEFGCSYCFQKDTVVEKGHGNVWVYLYESNSEPRTHVNSIDFAGEDTEYHSPVNGVKKLSVLFLIPFLTT